MGDEVEEEVNLPCSLKLKAVDVEAETVQCVLLLSKGVEEEIEKFSGTTGVISKGSVNPPSSFLTVKIKSVSVPMVIFSGPVMDNE
jgi:hypothetical protein